MALNAKITHRRLISISGGCIPKIGPRSRPPVRPTSLMPQTEVAQFQLYFQSLGIAEAEFERDVRLEHSQPPLLGFRGRPG